MVPRSTLRVLLPAALFLIPAVAGAATIANPVATFSGLDKITGRITNFDVYIDETVQFGALQITPRACYTRPATEVQQTSVFVEVDQVSLQQTIRRIFTGWMFADSPALNAIDHAVYDIWLVNCTQSSDVPPPSAQPGAAVSAPALEVEPALPPDTAAAPPQPAPEAGATPDATPADSSSFVTLGTPTPGLGTTFSPQ